mmetsp:Transcript_20930/g.52998  ORF Transcript_20930/g.52998 Transcript_20930/m.52998 type:complete len:202 (-) Transcript_20930:208-813(-)
MRWETYPRAQVSPFASSGLACRLQGSLGAQSEPSATTHFASACRAAACRWAASLSSPACPTHSSKNRCANAGMACPLKRRRELGRKLHSRLASPHHGHARGHRPLFRDSPSPAAVVPRASSSAAARSSSLALQNQGNTVPEELAPPGTISSRPSASASWASNHTPTANGSAHAAQSTAWRPPRCCVHPHHQSHGGHVHLRP